jgi:hypothetical protein
VQGLDSVSHHTRVSEEFFGITVLSADLGVSAITKFEAGFESFIQAEKRCLFT